MVNFKKYYLYIAASYNRVTMHVRACVCVRVLSNCLFNPMHACMVLQSLNTMINNIIYYIRACGCTYLYCCMVAAQAQFIGCFTDRNCSDRVVTERFNAEDCCVNNITGMYYNDGGQCFQCIGI